KVRPAAMEAGDTAAEAGADITHRPEGAGITHRPEAGEDTALPRTLRGPGSRAVSSRQKAEGRRQKASKRQAVSSRKRTQKTRHHLPAISIRDSLLRRRASQRERHDSRRLAQLLPDLAAQCRGPAR